MQPKVSVDFFYCLHQRISLFVFIDSGVPAFTNPAPDDAGAAQCFRPY